MEFHVRRSIFILISYYSYSSYYSYLSYLSYLSYDSYPGNHSEATPCSRIAPVAGSNTT